MAPARLKQHDKQQVPASKNKSICEHAGTYYSTANFEWNNMAGGLGSHNCDSNCGYTE